MKLLNHARSKTSRNCVYSSHTGFATFVFMCWSASASIAATALGTGGVIYGAKKGLPKAQLFTLAFFTLMELLQAVSYIWLGQCSATGNIVLTYLSYLHICLQPTVMSIFILSYAPAAIRKKWMKFVMGISFLATILLFLKFFVPIIWDVPQVLMCKIGDTLCGPDVCTYPGNWHLAWRLPLLGIIQGEFIYFTPVFLLPFLYGQGRMAIYHFFFGPVLAYLLTMNRNEYPAVWCLFSVALLCIMFFKPVKKVVRVR